MSVHSASVHHTTAAYHRQPNWEPPRRGLGITGLCVSGLGILGLAVLFSNSHGRPLTAGTVAWLTLTAVLILGGLQCARWGFSSARSSDTAREFGEDLFSVMSRLDDLAEKVDELTALTAQVIHESHAAAEAVEAPAEPEQKPAQQHAPRQRRRRNRRESAEATGATDNVVRLPTTDQRYTDALRRIAKKIVDDPDK